jgi:hypothetical protein
VYTMIRCNDDNGTKRKCDTIGHLWERNESWIVKKISSFYFFCVNYNLLDFKESKLTKAWDPSTRHWCEMRTRLKTSHRAKAQQSERWLLAVFWLISWRMKKASFLLTHSRVHCVYKRKKNMQRHYFQINLRSFVIELNSEMGKIMTLLFIMCECFFW